MKKIKRLFSMLLACCLITCMLPMVASSAEWVQGANGYAENGRVSFQGHTYQLIDGVCSTWQEAKAYCESLGGYLATITSQEENDFLYSYITEQGVQSAYFGFTDEAEEGTWVWVTGEPVSYTNWHTNEPNRENSNEDYAMFYYKYKDGTWNDGDFGKRTINSGTAFICEWGNGINVDISTDTWSFKNPSGCAEKYWTFWFPTLQGKKLSEFVAASRGGLCYGMALTSMALNSGSQSASDFSADSVSGIKKNSESKYMNISALEYIRYCFPLQVMASVADVSTANTNDLNGLYEAVKDFEDGKNAGVEIGVYGTYWFSNSGHALWGIRTIDGDTYSKIAVYDCNHPGEERYIILDKNKNGDFISWSYDIGLLGAGTWGTGESNAEISHVSFTESFFESIRNKIAGIESIYRVDFSGGILVAAAEGTTLSSVSDANVINICGIIEGSETYDTNETLYWIDDSTIYASSDGFGLGAELIGINSGVAVSSANGTSAVLSVSDQGEDSLYLELPINDTLSVTFSEVENDEDEIQTYVELTGLSGNYAFSATKDSSNGIVVSGLSEASATISKERRNSEGNSSIFYQLSCDMENLDPGHEYKIFEDGSKLVVYEDTNGDGMFDTLIASSSEPILFSDVVPGAWYEGAVRYVAANGLMTGYGDGRFGPNNNVTRGQFAQIMYNKEGKPAVTTLSGFTDVPNDAWYHDAVTWAADNQVVNGYGNGKYGPNNDITREQLAVMLWRYAGEPEAAGSLNDFTDAGKISGYADSALCWAVEHGIMQGKGNGILDPQGKATRAEVATMLMRYFENR